MVHVYIIMQVKRLHTIRTSQEKLNSAQLHVDICGGAGRGNTKKLEINLQ